MEPLRLHMAANDRQIAAGRDRVASASAACRAAALSARSGSHQTLLHQEELTGLKDRLRELEDDLAQSLSTSNNGTPSTRPASLLSVAAPEAVKSPLLLRARRPLYPLPIGTYITSSHMKTRKQPERQARQRRVKSDRQIKQPKLNTQSERSSPARFKVYPQSESCGSSPASGSMELEYEIFPSVSMDLRRRILLSLYNAKFSRNGDDQWRATDPSVLTDVQRFLQVVKVDLSIDKIKEHVIAMEDDVKLDLARVKRISEDRDSYYLVFNYVTPEFVHDPPPEPLLGGNPSTDIVPPEPLLGGNPSTDIVASEPHSREVFTSNRKKMKMTCNSDYSTNSCQSDSSIGEHFSKLMEDKEIAKELFKGPMSMENCTDKVNRCGFKGNELLCVLKLLRLNWEHRQIFMTLADSDAKDYALGAIYGTIPPSDKE